MIEQAFDTHLTDEQFCAFVDATVSDPRWDSHRARVCGTDPDARERWIAELHALRAAILARRATPEQQRAWRTICILATWSSSSTICRRRNTRRRNERRKIPDLAMMSLGSDAVLHLDQNDSAGP